MACLPLVEPIHDVAAFDYPSGIVLHALGATLPLLAEYLQTCLIVGNLLYQAHRPPIALDQGVLAVCCIHENAHSTIFTVDQHLSSVWRSNLKMQICHCLKNNSGLRMNECGCETKHHRSRMMWLRTKFKAEIHKSIHKSSIEVMHFICLQSKKCIWSAYEEIQKSNCYNSHRCVSHFIWTLLKLSTLNNCRRCQSRNPQVQLLHLHLVATLGHSPSIQELSMGNGHELPNQLQNEHVLRHREHTTQEQSTKQNLWHGLSR